MHIITTLDDSGVEEYLRLAGSIQRQRRKLDELTTVVLTGDVTAESKETLASHADKVESFCELEVYKELHPLQKAIGHPLGKFAKLYFALEYIVANDVDGAVVFLDPDTYVQRPLADFEALVVPGVLLFGHELQHVHLAHRPNARLNVAMSFDDKGPWWATYFSEVNTGVILGLAEDFKRVIEDFKRFTFESDYFTNRMYRLKKDHWHDQDCFRYFLRKTMPLDVGVFDIDQVFTTTKCGAKCIHFVPEHNRYATSWNRLPYVVHFAGGTWSAIMAEAPATSESAPIVYEDESPWRESPLQRYPLARSILDTSPLDVAKGVLRRYPLVGRILDTSPLDVARSLRNFVRSRTRAR